MDNLPQELINRIVWFAERYPAQNKWYPSIAQAFNPKGPKSEFPRLAILNRHWKEAIETVTFHRLGIKSTELYLLQSIVTGNRRKYLTSIDFTAILPQYSEEACAHRESRAEQHANDEAFTKGICDLFAVLRTWEGDGVQSALRLDILTPSSPTDSRMCIDDPARRKIMNDIALGSRADILSDRWENSRLHLLEPDSLPTLYNVQHLTITGNGSRTVIPSAAPNLAVSLPELKTVEWEFPDCSDPSDEESDRDSLNSDSDSEPDKELAASPKVRGETRLAFANKLRETKFRSLHSAQVTFVHQAPFDQRATLPSIVAEGLTHDPFSAALCTFSQRLTTFTLSAHLDSTLFWPNEQTAATPYWPHLKSLDITLDMVTPSGDWYFTGPRPVDHPDDDVESGTVGGVDEREYSYMDFRIHPDPQTFDPFLGAFAKAVGQMPVLEFFMLTSELVGNTGKLHISYHAPGTRADWGDEGPEDLERRRIYYACEVGEVWIPEPETAERLRGAGMQKFGGEVIERYVGSQYY
jgi:hypothetical protein